MKRSTFLIVLTFFCLAITAQVPQAFKYQTVIRDANGDVLSDQEVNFRFTISQRISDLTDIYTEVHSTTTNDYGMVSLDIGKGEVTFGSFASINWKEGTHFLTVEIDVDGSDSYISMGTTQFLSVPFALHSGTADSIDDDDADPANELQVLSISNDTIFLSNGGFVVLPKDGIEQYVAGDGLLLDSNEFINTAPDQEITLTGAGPVSITGEYPDFTISSVIHDSSSTNEIQSISVAGNDIILSRGGGTAAIPNHLSTLPSPDLPVPIRYQGGIIHVHPTDNASHIRWGENALPVGATSLTDGKINTSIIVDSLGADSNYAAHICDTLDAFGYSDWYLPSIYELDAMYKQSYLLKDLDITRYYWSSTEAGGNEAWRIYIFNGGSTIRPKNDLIRCRCVRRDDF